MSERQATWLVWLGSAAILVAALATGEPFWMENDDVSMAMLAHGYGIVSTPSPLLVFSNALYGEFLAALPDIGGIQPYGIATYVLLAAAGAATVASLLRAAVPAAPASAAVLAIYLPAALYPQFTVLAGLLGAAGILWLAVPAGTRLQARAPAVLLLLAGALVRPHEVLLVAAISSPFLIAAWRKDFAAARRGAAAGAVAIALIGACLVYDWAQYRSAPWREFFAYNALRVSFTDYGYAQYFMRYPEEAAAAGFTKNDIGLMRSFFFSDASVFSQARLERLAAQVSTPRWLASNLTAWQDLVDVFKDRQLVALLALLALAGWRRPSLALAASAALFVGAALATLLAGRPSALHIYPPLLSAVLLLQLTRTPHEAWGRWGRLAALAIAVVLSALYSHRNTGEQPGAERARRILCRLADKGPYVSWGNAVPYDRVYAPLVGRDVACSIRYFPVSVHSRAPHVLPTLQEMTGKGDLVSALLAGQEIQLLARVDHITGLATLLREHHGATLSRQIVAGYVRFSLYRVKIVQP